MIVSKLVLGTFVLCALGAALLLVSCKEALPEGVGPIEDLVLNGALDRFRWLPIRYFEPKYEAQIIERFRQFAVENRSSRVMSRLVLCALPPPDGTETPLTTAQAICFRGSAVATLGVGGHSHVIPLFGEPDRLAWIIDGRRFELHSFAVSPAVGWIELTLVSPVIPAPAIGLTILEDLRKDIGVRSITLNISEYGGDSGNKVLPRLPISDQILPSFDGAHPYSAQRVRRLSCASRIGSDPRCWVTGGQEKR